MTRRESERSINPTASRATSQKRQALDDAREFEPVIRQVKAEHHMGRE